MMASWSTNDPRAQSATSCTTFLQASIVNRRRLSKTYVISLNKHGVFPYGSGRQVDSRNLCLQFVSDHPSLRYSYTIRGIHSTRQLRHRSRPIDLEPPKDSLHPRSCMLIHGPGIAPQTTDSLRPLSCMLRTTQAVRSTTGPCSPLSIQTAPIYLRLSRNTTNTHD